MGKKSVICLIVALAVAGGVANDPACSAFEDSSIEWDANKALTEWPDQRSIWAPVSWRDHLNEFNVLFNGTIVASNYCAFGWREDAFDDDETGFSFGVDFHAGSEINPKRASWRIRRFIHPDGRHLSRWSDSTAPVYIVEHQLPAVLIEQRQFAHIPGGSSTKRGDEPLFLWVRCEISSIIELVNDFDRIACALTALSDHLRPDNEAYNNLPASATPWFYPTALVYAGDKTLSKSSYLRGRDPNVGIRNRLALPLQSSNELMVKWYPRAGVETKDSEKDSSAGEFDHLMITMPCRAGAKFDFVISYGLVEDEVMDRELALGYDGALTEAEQFWKEQLQPGAVFKVPEPLVQGHLDHFAPLSFMISEKHPKLGYPVLVTSSYKYRVVWATPMSLELTALDRMGYAQDVERYLDVFRKTQGKVKPPSPYLEKHPGYLGTPRPYETLTDWLADHGAILYAAAFHGLLTMDQEFLDKWTDPILRACEWIESARKQTNHDGISGILPPAVASDRGLVDQQVWNDAWVYKGLAESARLLKRMNHPRASQIHTWVEEYRNDFQEIMRQAVSKSKKWLAPNGDQLPFVPAALGKKPKFPMKDPFYLDAGPMVLVWGGLFDASDPVMQANVRWFREGPQWLHYRPNSNHRQVPVLDREISSCEPCYSWVYFHTLQLGDRRRFSMGLYGLLAGGASQQTYVSCESWEAVFGNTFSTSVFIHLMVDSVLEQRDDELHLMRMVPLGFLRNGGFSWERVPTSFGPVSIKASMNKTETQLEIQFTPPSRFKPKAVYLHVPPVKSLTGVKVNGKIIKTHPGECVQI